MTTTALEIDAPPDEPVIHTRRFVQAPPELVFDVLTRCEHLSRWWGPRRLELVVCEIDLRVGGAYRFVQRAPDGQEFTFSGEFLEVEPPHRLVQTFTFAGMPEDVAVGTFTLEQVDGGTVIDERALHGSIAARDQHLANGMEGGMRESYDRLDELLASLSS